MSKPKPKPKLFTASTKTMAVAPTVAPKANDMMFPLIVISVMPIATQPMNDTVVSSDNMLGPERKPGVVRMTAARTTIPIDCAAENKRARSCQGRARPADGRSARSTPAFGLSLMHSPASGG